MKNKIPTERFTETVQDYIKYRPSYPQEILQLLINEGMLTKETIIADIGSGTGFLTKLFLDHGNEVYGVEPNQAMREAAEGYLKQYGNFHSTSGSAEATSLKDQSIDLITAGTAFHWFDATLAKNEFKRILRNPGWVLLTWNVRNIQESALVADYEKLILQFCPDYRASNAIKFEQTAGQDFFNPHQMKQASFKNSQRFDWLGFKGRLLSSSYSLRPEDSHYQQMLNTLKTIFERHEIAGTIEFLYETKLYYGHLLP